MYLTGQVAPLCLEPYLQQAVCWTGRDRLGSGRCRTRVNLRSRYTTHRQKNRCFSRDILTLFQLPYKNIRSTTVTHCSDLDHNEQRKNREGRGEERDKDRGFYFHFPLCLCLRKCISF